MTVAGQAGVNYSYDNDNRLIQIVQGSSTVSFAYDAGNWRTSLTLPNRIVMSYSHHNASQLTGISYLNGSTNLSSPTYGHDLAGRRISMGGSCAQTGLSLPRTTGRSAQILRTRGRMIALEFFDHTPVS
jgi:YD repeat-containing protein